jgi:hypothetical protein
MERNQTAQNEQSLTKRLALRGQEEVFRPQVNASLIRSLQEVLLNICGDSAARPSARPLMRPPMHSGDISFREIGDGTCSTAHSDNSCSRF